MGLKKRSSYFIQVERFRALRCVLRNYRLALTSAVARCCASTGNAITSPLRGNIIALPAVKADIAASRVNACRRDQRSPIALWKPSAPIMIACDKRESLLPQFLCVGQGFTLAAPLAPLTRGLRRRRWGFWLARAATNPFVLGTVGAVYFHIIIGQITGQHEVGASALVELQPQQHLGALELREG